ncbi:hypothetical protein DWX08_09510 [Ruminococcus sp. AF18-22]|nr:hypothetical protein DWX08_09510 [Ruminococcus sp. AF18-22]
MAYENYQKVTGTIQNVTSGSDCCSQMVSIMTDSNMETINLIISPETQVIDSVRLRKGMRVAAFYDTSLPAPAIFPPQYQAELVAVLRREQNVMLDYFDETLTAQNNALQLNLTPFTNIMTANGQRYTCFPENADLLVYYTATTFSIPPQTTPQKIVVLCSY